MKFHGDKRRCLVSEESTQVFTETVGERMFWVCQELTGPISQFVSKNPMRANLVNGYLILQCDNMIAMPYQG